MHPFVKINPKKDFEILADSDKGAEIIQWRETILLKAEFSDKYPNMQKILHNYIQVVIKKLRYEGLASKLISKK